MPCIVVLGMHRSGTSLVASLCQKLGVNMGTTFRAGDTTNPDGYFEDLDWRAINKWILNTAGGTWYDPPSMAEISRQTERIEPVIKAMVAWKSKSSVWGFKDPRTCLTIHALHKYLPDPRYVLVTRPEAQIVNSLIRRSEKRGYSELTLHWSCLTQRYISSVEKFIYRHDPKFFEVSYGDLTFYETPAREVLINLAMFLSTPPSMTDMAIELIRFRDGSHELQE